MRTLKASFLLIGPWESRYQELGAHIASDLQQAIHWINDSIYDVIALSVTLVLGKNFPSFYEHIVSTHPSTQFIVVIPPDFSAGQMTKLHEQYKFSRVLQSFQDPQVELSLFSALEEANRQKQNLDLQRLIQEQTNQLKRLQIELEERVQKRTKYLTETRRKLYLTNSRIEGFRKALTAVHKAGTVSEIETLLTEALASTVKTSWIRIFFEPQDDLFVKQIKEQQDFDFQKIQLYRDHDKVGSIFFLRTSGQKFLKDEIEFLNRVAEAVALALDRIQKLNETESLKEQWDATFTSVSDPILIIDTNYDVIQSNQIFTDVSTRKHGSKCYELLFDRNTPCAGCKRGLDFKLTQVQSDSRNFEVMSQSLLLNPDSPPVFLNLYHDTTEQTKMERQILESAKMAELGTIGSSIAHELNNPLGGILSFTQLIKMDMKPEHPMYQDVLEMEKGVQRCKEIVQNLLGFTRDPNFDKESIYPLYEVYDRAFKIIELQFKGEGIKYSLPPVDKSIVVLGHFNLLAQAFKNLLQFFSERITRELKIEANFEPLLEVSLKLDSKQIEIYISDRLPKDRKTSIPSGIGISVAQQIITDHKGVFDLEHSEGLYNQAKITLPRPVL